MTPNSSKSRLPAVVAALTCSFAAPTALAQTRAIPDPVGIRADSTSSQSQAFASVAKELIRRSKLEKIRALRGKYKGLLPSVDEYLRMKRQEAD